MPKPKQRKQPRCGSTVIISLSLHAIPYRKLLQLAQTERNGNRSAAVERMVELAWRRRYGMGVGR